LRNAGHCSSKHGMLQACSSVAPGMATIWRLGVEASYKATNFSLSADFYRGRETQTQAPRCRIHGVSLFRQSFMSRNERNYERRVFRP